MLNFGQTVRFTVAQHLDVVLEGKRIHDASDKLYFHEGGRESGFERGRIYDKRRSMRGLIREAAIRKVMVSRLVASV